MAWTTPRTWVTQELVTVANLNEQIRDNMLLLKTSIDASGKLTALSATYVADLSGSNLTGIARTAAASTYTAGKQNFNGGATVRVVLPVGADKWAT